jgi:DNA-3-methyladenine glycosylase I
MHERCGWAVKNELMRDYHDREWGVPVFDDEKLFEFLILEGFQAGLSWQIVLNKREAFRKAFDGFDAEKVARYSAEKIESLIQDATIIRNRQKITASVINAQKFLEVQNEYGSFSDYIWSFTEKKPNVNAFTSLSELPARTPLSDKISVDLIKRGFKFVGSTIIYAHMQATGMVNDHLVTCFRYGEISRLQL